MGQGRQEGGCEVECNIQDVSWVVLLGHIHGRKRGSLYRKWEKFRSNEITRSQRSPRGNLKLECSSRTVHREVEVADPYEYAVASPLEQTT